MSVVCALYEGERGAREIPLAAVHATLPSDRSFAWVRLVEPTARELEEARRTLGVALPPTRAGPGADPVREPGASDGSLRLMVRTAARGESGEVDLGELGLILRDRLLVSVHSGAGAAAHEPGLDDWTERREHEPEDVLCALVEEAVRGQESLVAELEVDAERLQELVLSTVRMYKLDRLFRTTDRVLRLRRAVGQQAEELGRLPAAEPPPGTVALRERLGELHRRVVRMRERLDEVTPLLNLLLQAHQTRAGARHAELGVSQAEVSRQQNEDVRRISAWVAIVAVPTMMAGIYGMNFEYMPELDWTFGYPLALGVMAVACISLYRFFRRIGWL